MKVAARVLGKFIGITESNRMGRILYWAYCFGPRIGEVVPRIRQSGALCGVSSAGVDGNGVVTRVMLWSLSVIGALGVGLIVLYNRLVRDRIRVASAWSDIDVQLKRRHDLLPNLVAAVSQYASYERAALESITELRARSERASKLGAGASEIGAAEAALSAGMGNLFALVESYPDLKADANFLDLQRNISDVEQHIQYARRYYNAAVRALNTRIDSFPDLLVAKAFAYRHAEYFETDDVS